MFDDSELKQSILLSDGTCLSNMLDIDGLQLQETWTTEELEAILRHQLAVPLLDEVENEDPAAADKLRSLLTMGISIPRYLHMLFHENKAPAIEMLQALKAYAKSRINHPVTLVPKEISYFIYYSIIAVAIVRCGHRLTILSDTDLKKGFTWVLNQPWVEEEIQQLFEEGLQRLRTLQHRFSQQYPYDVKDVN